MPKNYYIHSAVDQVTIAFSPKKEPKSLVVFSDVFAIQIIIRDIIKITKRIDGVSIKTRGATNFFKLDNVRSATNFANDLKELCKKSASK